MKLYKSWDNMNLPARDSKYIKDQFLGPARFSGS